MHRVSASDTERALSVCSIPDPVQYTLELVNGYDYCSVVRTRRFFSAPIGKYLEFTTSMNASATPDGRPEHGVSRRKKFLFAGIVWIVCTLLLYTASIGWRSYRRYAQLKTHQRGWKVPIHESDPQLGFRLIPGVETDELLPDGPLIPTRIDSRGFRVPVDPSRFATGKRPLVMTFGCSFTFGAACAAEDTYPQLVARELGGECVNAGVCSYGLTQMLIRARQLIPRQRPGIVIAQYSPWLVDRAMSLYAPTTFGLQPSPYFTRTDAGGLIIAPPVFTRSSVDPTRYRDTPRSFGDFASFLFSVGVPSLVHDDSLGTLTWAKQKTGLMPAPTRQRQAVVDAVYGEFDKLCQQVGARLVIVILEEVIPVRERDALDAATHAIVVDAYSEMVLRMPVREPTVYEKLYCHWRGDPPVLVDYHPNARAHKIIAAEITKALETSPVGSKN